MIGLVGCTKGYNSKKGTEGVGEAANVSVVVSMGWGYNYRHGRNANHFNAWVLITMDATPNMINQKNAIAPELVIEIEHLQKAFGSNVVLRDFNLTVQKGENVVIMGKSGIGKTILIKCIIGLIKPDGGTLRVFGQDISKLNHHDLDELRTRIGFIFQSSALYDSMTVRQNLEFPLRRHRRKKYPRL